MKIKKFTFLDFIGSEIQNKLKTISNLKGYFDYFKELDEIYKDIDDVFVIDPNEDIHKIVATLFLQAHNEFYISISQLLSSHLGKSLISLRIAIEAAYFAYYFTKNPEDSKIFYEKKIKIKNKFISLNAYMANNPIEYPLAQELIEKYNFISSWSVHSSFKSIALKIKKKENAGFITFNYFDDLEPFEKFLGFYFTILMVFLKVYKLFYESFYKKELRVHYPLREERLRKLEEIIKKQYYKYSLTKIEKEKIKKESKIKTSGGNE